MDEGNSYLFARLFILTAKEYLAVEHREHISKGMTINIMKFRLTPNKYIKKIRERIFSGISRILKNEKYTQSLNELLKHYTTNIPFNGGEMLLSDLPVLDKYIISKLDREKTSHCLLVGDLTERLKSTKTPYPEYWDTEFKNTILDISILLLEDRTERRILEMSCEDYESYRKDQVSSYFSDKTLDEIKKFFNQCIDLYSSITGRERNYSLNEGLKIVFRVLAKTHPDDFLNIVSNYLEHDDIFSLNPHGMMKSLLENNDSQEIYDFIDSKTFKRKNSWKTCWYSQLSVNDINEKTVSNFLSHLKSIDLDSIPIRIGFLDNYTSVDKYIYSKTAQILTGRAEENIHFIRPLSNLFNNCNDNFGKSIELFNGDTTLLLISYLLSFRLDIHFDCSGECLSLLMDYDKSLLNKVIDAIYEKENYSSSCTSMPDLKFLWERTSYYEDIETYAKHVFEKGINLFSFGDSIFTQLFAKEKGVEDTSEIADKKCRFLKKSISENINNIDYICFIFEASTYMSEDVRIELIVYFLSLNQDIEDFKRVDFEFTTDLYSGSKVPYFEKEKGFLMKIIPRLNSIDLLDHKSYIEQQIESKDRAIEYEKNRDFLSKF